MNQDRKSLLHRMKQRRFSFSLLMFFKCRDFRRVNPPLPPNRKRVELASFRSFEKIQEIIKERFSVESEKRHYGWRENGKNGVSIVFHEKIGAHDIVVAMTSDSTELVKWVNNFLEGNNVAKVFLKTPLSNDNELCSERLSIPHG